MALVHQRQLTSSAWLRRLLAVALTVAALTPSAGSAQEPDPEATEQQRDDVRARQAEVVLELDALEAKDAEVRAALAEWLPVRLPAVATERHPLGAAVVQYIDGRWPLVVGLAGGGDEHVAA